MKIRKISRRLFSGLVYNIRCSPDHNYFCENILVHNCDVPKVGPGVNASLDDLLNQVATGISLHPEVKYTQRLNIHFARMGEPTFNWSVIEAARLMRCLKHFKNFNVHPVVSTMMPRESAILDEFIEKWLELKNIDYEGEAGLQISVNSTDEDERDQMFNGKACTLQDIGNTMDTAIQWSGEPVGRKITLNFAIAGWTIDPNVLLKYFDPKYYIIKLTPMHKTVSALKNDIKTEGDYTAYHPYENIENKLKAAGYDVLVFVASREEDEGRITCGNATLSGSKVFEGF